MKTKERCDRCKKWVQEGNLFTLEGIVSDGIDPSFAICQKCLDKYSDWDSWALQPMNIHPEYREAIAAREVKNG